MPGPRLTLAEREEIVIGHEHGETLELIAGRVGRCPSTVSRELRRNRPVDGPYRACAAQNTADDRARRPRAARQNAGRLKVDHPDEPERRVSHETIYQALYLQGRGGLRAELTDALRTGRARRRPKGPNPGRGSRGTITGMVSISERPAEAEDRAVPGHWEGDLIIGKASRSQIGTIVERTTRFVLLVALPDDRRAATVADAIAGQIRRLPGELARSLTWDQGKEMAAHASFTIDTGVQVYFCDPHSPWQRGTNENTNGLLRQYFPKGTDLSLHTQDDLDVVAAQLNGRPRQTLGFATPSEKLNALLATAS